MLRAESSPVPRVTVIIPAYKRPELVRRAVLSLFAQDLERDQYEVLVVDSSPDQRTVEAIDQLRTSAPCELRVLVKEPEGPGPSRTLGVKHARGEFIAFMDSDCQAAAGWLRAGLAGFTAEVGIVQGRTEPDPAGPRGVFTWYVLVEKESFVYECCNLFYRRKALEEAGEFRRSLFPTWKHPPSGEDVDMAWRVKRNGWKTRFVSGALVYHALIPISWRQWVANEGLFMCPALARDFPELRRCLFRGYFYDRAQQCLLLALLGIASIWITPLAAICCIPYVALRMFEPSATLKGLLRVVRLGSYLTKDIASLLLLVSGSVRYRSLLI